MELNFLEFGEKGRPIIFIHGWQQDCYSLTPLVPFLQNMFRVFLLELPGFGKSKIPSSIKNSEDYASLIYKWIVEKKLAPAVIVGHSFGGRIAGFLAFHYPEIVSQLILISPAGIPEARIWYRFKNLIPASIKNTLRPFLTSQDYKNAGPLLSLFKNIVKEDLRLLYPKMAQPTLIIWGKDDKILPYNNGEVIQKLIPNCKLEILPGDHFLFQQNPDKVAKLISDFAK